MRENVTVYVPAYNAEASLEACLSGILKQTYPPSEIIVVDDGSTDGTADVCRRFPVVLLQAPVNQGLAASRNTAIKAAKSEYVGALDADCVPQPEWLEHLMKNFDAADVAGVGGAVFEKNESPGADHWRAQRMKQKWDPQTKNPEFLFGSNTLFRKSILLESGLYDEKYRGNFEDVDISRKINACGYKLRYEPEAVVDHLKKDSMVSLFKNFWKWNYHFYEEKKFYADLSKIKTKIRDNIGYSNRLVREDIGKGDISLLYFDFAMSVFVTLLDMAYFFSNFKDIAPEQAYNGFSGYFNLMELSFFEKADRRRKTTRTLISRSFALEQNMYLAIVLIENYLAHRKVEREIRKKLSIHLLALFLTPPQACSLLAPSILHLAEKRDGWEDFLKKPHRNIETETLGVFMDSFRGFYDGLFDDFKKLNFLLQRSFEMVKEQEDGDV